MKIVTRILWASVGLGLALYAALTLWLAFVGLTPPYQLDYGEGIVLWFAQELARGHAIYKSLDVFPYASSNYPPVALLLSVALMPIFGDGYLGGRLLNFAAALIIAALIFRLVRDETRNSRAALIAALLFGGSPYIYHWIPLFRVDLLGLAFAFAGVFFVLQWQRQRRAVYFLLFTFSFLLALYTKHTLFAAPVAAFLALFQRDKRAAFAFACALGASGGAIYLALDWFTHGGFTAGLIDSNATVFLPEQLLALLNHFALTFPILLLLAAGSWVDRVRAKKIGVREGYALIFFAALAMAGRVGAWENYFFEALALGCLFAGFQISNFKFRILNFPIRNSQFAILLLIQLALFARTTDPRIAADLVARDLPANRALSALLARTEGVILSEDMGALATSGKPVAYYTYQYSMLARSGKWDQRFELDGLREQKFPLVILEQGTREDVEHYRRFTREFVSTLDRHYALAQTIGKYRVYTPAPPLKLQAANFGDAIALVGWNVQPENLKPGIVELTTVWQAHRVLPHRFVAFAHLERAAGARVTQDDHEPRGGMYPTTRWAAGEMVRDTFTLNVPENLSPGTYVLRLGWYDSETGDRLAVPGSADDAFELTRFQVQ